MPTVWFYPSDDSSDSEDYFGQAFLSAGDILEISRVPSVGEHLRLKGIIFEVLRVIHALDDNYDAAVEVRPFYDEPY